MNIVINVTRSELDSEGIDEDILKESVCGDASSALDLDIDVKVVVDEDRQVMWEVEKYDTTGSCIARWGGCWLPGFYSSREEAMEGLLNYVADCYGGE